MNKKPSLVEATGSGDLAEQTKVLNESEQTKAADTLTKNGVDCWAGEKTQPGQAPDLPDWIWQPTPRMELAAEGEQKLFVKSV